MPLGMGYTVEGQVTGKEEHGGLQVIVYEPKPGRFPEKPPPMAMERAWGIEETAAMKGASMGLAAGGKIAQKIYPDPHGLDTWDEGNYGRVFIHIVNSVMWTEITGEAPPPTPVTAKSYTQAGYPWFQLYDEEAGDVSASPVLQVVKSVAQMDAQHGFVGVEDNDSVTIPPAQVKGLPKNVVPDGDW